MSTPLTLCVVVLARHVSGYFSIDLPTSCRQRIAIEAGVTAFWYRFVGLDGRVVGIDRFGLSAPGGTVMKELGITTEHLVEVAKAAASARPV